MPFTSENEYTQVVLKADEPTLNGNVYTKEVLEAAVAEYNAKPQERRLGPVNIDDGRVRLKEVGFEVKQLRLTGPLLSADLKLLSNKNGQVIREQLKSGKFRVTVQSLSSSKTYGILKDVRFMGFYTTSTLNVDLYPEPGDKKP